MFGIYKAYLKYKLLSKIKDEAILYQKMKAHYVESIEAWKSKKHDSEADEKTAKKRIEYLRGGWVEAANKLSAIDEVIKIIDDL